MNIETRKLNFIKEILMITNQQVIEELEQVLDKNKQDIDVVLQQKLTSRALKAEKEIENGDFLTIEEVEKELSESFNI